MRNLLCKNRQLLDIKKNARRVGHFKFIKGYPKN